MIPSEIERLLPKVQKPARYCGGEINSIIKDKSRIATRVAFCFPDLYEVGMSHLGMKILYSVVNRLDYAWCERVFAPDVDMEEKMRENGIKLWGRCLRPSPWGDLRQQPHFYCHSLYRNG